MKNLKMMIIIATAMVTAVSCGPKKETQKEEAPKMLVARALTLPR